MRFHLVANEQRAASQQLPEPKTLSEVVDHLCLPPKPKQTGDTGTAHRMTQPDAYRMLQRRARQAGIKTHIGNHSLRATGITDYLKSDGTLENAQQMANHSSPRTTKLYDRRNEETSLDEYERIGI